jgi:hypothetical protein
MASKYLSRRAFVRLGLGAGVLGASAGLGLWWLRGTAPEVQGLGVLSAAQYRTLAALSQVHLPPCPSIAISGVDLDLARLFDTYLFDQPPADQSEAQLALQLVEYGPLLFDHRLVTFSNLSADQQLAHWTGWSRSSNATRREIYWSFARFFGLAFYDQERVWPAIGYPGPSLARLQK